MANSSFEGMVKAGVYFSPTQRKLALKRAGYTTHNSLATAPRCSNCVHCRPFSGRSGTAYDRDCGAFKTTVKTHGHCRHHSPADQSAPPGKPEARCRLCGCTDNHACPGGCWWVEPDLCSACHEKPW